MDRRGGVGRCRGATGPPANRLPGRALGLAAGIVVGQGACIGPACRTWSPHARSG